MLRSGEYWDHPEGPLAEAQPNVPEAYEEAAIPQGNDEQERSQPELAEAEAAAQALARPRERLVRIRRPPARYADFV